MFKILVKAAKVQLEWRLMGFPSPPFPSLSHCFIYKLSEQSVYDPADEKGAAISAHQHEHDSSHITPLLHYGLKRTTNRFSFPPKSLCTSLFFLLTCFVSLKKKKKTSLFLLVIKSSKWPFIWHRMDECKTSLICQDPLGKGSQKNVHYHFPTGEKKKTAT